MTLSGVFQSQIAYAEGDRNHPFLEEVVSLLATFFESTQDYRNSLYMWHHFLGIQERLFSEDKKEMITTYKKIATLHSQCGNPASAAKFFDKTQALIERFQTGESQMNDEEKKESLEEKAALYFQMYLTANQQGEVAKSIEYIQKQTEC